MTEAPDYQSYIDIYELSARTGLSPAMLWRLKRTGKITFFQPGGKGYIVRFPLDAIEQATQQLDLNGDEQQASRLSGPRPSWMTPKPSTITKESKI